MAEEEKYPASAISSWSGFVYQGKVALYHCLKLIQGGDLDFELQLDSTEDFAIYKNKSLISAHQVKAKVGVYRSTYTDALNKCGAISGDRIKGTDRYFHISVKINDLSDYHHTNNEVVKFYYYGSQKYCGLDEIEPLTKPLIKSIYKDHHNKDCSENNLRLHYYYLSEKISSKAIEIHQLIQNGGVSEAEAAYSNTISAKEIFKDITERDPYSDVEHFAIELRSNLNAYLEYSLDQALPDMTEIQYERAQSLFTHVQSLSPRELDILCQMIKPSENFSKVQQIDIERYSDLVTDLQANPILEGLPHYIDKDVKFYLPTAITLLSKREQDRCPDHLRKQLTENESLLRVLYEYNNLIARNAISSFNVDTKITESDEEPSDGRDDRITKGFEVSVLTMKDAEDKLNA